MTIDTQVREVGPTDQLFLGPNITHHRKLEGLTMSEVSRRMRIDPSIVTLWERDQRPVPHNRVAALAQALEVTEAMLLDDARVVVDGYRAGRLPPDVPQVPPQAAPLPPTPPPLPPLAPLPPPMPQSMYALLWCSSRHGGELRRHHHGPAPSWAPGVTTIAEFWGGTDTVAYVSLRAGRPAPAATGPRPSPSHRPAPPAARVVREATSAPGGLSRLESGPAGTRRCTACGGLTADSGAFRRTHLESARHMASIELAEAMEHA